MVVKIEHRVSRYYGRKLSLSPNQALFALGWAGLTLALTRTNLLNPTSGRDASHPCLISLKPKEGCTVVCVIDSTHPKVNNTQLGPRLSFLPQIHIYIYIYNYFMKKICCCTYDAKERGDINQHGRILRGKLKK